MIDGVHKECKIMFNKETVVRCESGLHNRQATYFVQKANPITAR